MAGLKERLLKAQEESKKVEENVRAEELRPDANQLNAAKTIAESVAQNFSAQITGGSQLTPEQHQKIAEHIKEQARESAPTLEEQKRIERIATDAILGWGPLQALIDDPDVSEIIVARYDHILYEKSGKLHPSQVAYGNEAALVAAINKIVQLVNRSVNVSNPIVDARLPDGSRVHATLPPASPDGATLNIRKFTANAMTGGDYVDCGSMSRPMLVFLSKCVQAKVSLMVSGGTSTGKTTLLNMLSGFIPDDEYIITIEDSLELRLNQPNVTRMEVSEHASAQALVKSALRMRPDRIVVGEARDGTIVDMFSAMSTGHEGSLATIHANNPANLVNMRIPILYSHYKGMTFSEDAINAQISEALMLIVHISRIDGKRIVTHITQVNGRLDSGRVRLADLFLYDRDSGEFKATGTIPKSLLKYAQMRGVEINESLFAK